MTLNVIELNDAAVRISRDGGVVCESPGVALVDHHELLAGAAAAARAHLNPRAVHNHFWQQLNELPLPYATRHFRHHADLAYHHLQAVLAAAGRPAEAVLAVSGHYTDSELSLLLGVAAASGVRVAGLVDTAVAAVAGCAPPGRYMVADLHQHHVTLTTVAVDDFVTRIAVETVDQAGLNRIHAACVDLLADALLGQSRFDALHEAETEQLLYDHLPQWLAQARTAAELRIQIEYRGNRFHARIPAREFDRVTAMVLAAVSEHLHGHTQLLLGAAVAALPGALDQLAPALALPADACYRGIAEHRLALAPAAGGVAFVTRLPATRQPVLTLPARDPRGAGDPAQPTHVLAGSQAQPLGSAPLYLHADGALALEASGAATCSVTLEASRVLLRVNGVETRVNGEAVTGTRELRSGDHITLHGGRTLFIPIIVSDSSAP